MSQFHAPVDDILFSLCHVAQAAETEGWDLDLATDVLSHFGLFAEGVIAPLNRGGDSQGARLENGRVQMPPGFGAAYRQLADDGWQGLCAPEIYGGMAASPLIAAGVSEIFSGANHALQMVCNLVPGAINTLLRFGTAQQQAKWIPKLASGEVLSTMCLTEAGAGSDLSGIRCKAEKATAGWRITGEKVFISGGDQDMSAGILHLVLARSGSPAAGINGLSLFLCPAQPSISITRLEDKLGLHGSPTCQMYFAAAEAELIGVEGAGLKAMFTVMNHARLDVALQGVGHAARAGQIAASYAAERMQGRRADGAAAALSDHADVRRMLDEQRCLAVGARAMCHIALVELETRQRPALADFLTPLCKIFGSEAGIRAADLGIQVLGGYGYLDEYEIGQTWRDARITAIYEGANGIHERSIATRGLRPGAGAEEFAALIQELAHAWPLVMADLRDWQNWRAQLAVAPDPLTQAHGFAQATGRLFYCAAWARIAEVAAAHSDSADLNRLAQLVLK